MIAVRGLLLTMEQGNALTAFAWIVTHERNRVMRSILLTLAVLLVATAIASPAHAVPPGYPDCCFVPKPQAPDAVCGCPSWYRNAYGGVYGPMYNVYPPFMPWNGLLPAPSHGYPTQPYTRSPRDYFMYEDMSR
jgi:hypothetical protein